MHEIQHLCQLVEPYFWEVYWTALDIGPEACICFIVDEIGVSLFPSRRVIDVTISIHLLHDPLASTSNEEEIISSSFSGNSKANASKCLQNIEERSPRYYIHLAYSNFNHTIVCYPSPMGYDVFSLLNKKIVN